MFGVIEPPVSVIVIAADDVHTAPTERVFVGAEFARNSAAVANGGIAAIAVSTAAVTKAVVAKLASLSPASGVGACGSPIKCGLSSGAPPVPIAPPCVVHFSPSEYINRNATHRRRRPRLSLAVGELGKLSVPSVTSRKAFEERAKQVYAIVHITRTYRSHLPLLIAWFNAARKLVLRSPRRNRSIAAVSWII